MARKALGVVIDKAGFREGWHWCLPHHDTPNGGHAAPKVPSGAEGALQKERASSGLRASSQPPPRPAQDGPGSGGNGASDHADDGDLIPPGCRRCFHCNRVGRTPPNKVAIGGRTVWLHPECEAGWMAALDNRLSQQQETGNGQSATPTTD
jgi:hypothetical protein